MFSWGISDQQYWVEIPPYLPKELGLDNQREIGSLYNLWYRGDFIFITLFALGIISRLMSYVKLKHKHLNTDTIAKSIVMSLELKIVCVHRRWVEGDT